MRRLVLRLLAERRAAEQARLDAPRAPPLELEDDGGGYDPYDTAARRLGAAIAARTVLTRAQRRAVRDTDTELKRLRERVTALETAGRAVLDAWESGDLATAVRELGEVLE